MYRNNNRILWRPKMSVSTAYEYTCQFCNAVQDVLASMQIAKKAASAASRGDYKKARAIVLENSV